jgi:hypothetical protein
MNKSLNRQVEKILDESGGETQTVIVQMENPARQPDPVLEVIVETIRRRGLLMSARDILPRGRVSDEDCPGRDSAPSADDLVTKVAMLAGAAPTLADIRRAGLKSLEPLLDSDISRRAIYQARQTQEERFDPESVNFWPGSAAFLDLAPEDLRRLPEAVPGISGIYPNRSIPPPFIVEHERLTSEVSEGRPHAWGIEKINALAVWGAHGTRGRGVTVGMLDTGVDFSHPDLRDKMRPGGWAEFDVDGNQVAGSEPHDTSDHGTMCAGTIVGGNQSGGWIGVAPEAQLVVALVIDGVKGGSEKQALAGLKWMLEQGVDVINMSIGKFIADPETPPVFAEAMYNCVLAGIPAVVAIGNEGAQTTDSPGNDMFAYSVGATDLHDNPAGFSGGRTQILRSPNIPINPALLPFLYKKPEIAAPGVAIKTSAPGDLWSFGSGTSLATSHVSGAAALLLSATTIREYTQASMRTFAVEDSLSGAVVELGESGLDQRFGWGRLDVLRAISFAHEHGFKPEA